jgi:hypothetical protein
MRAFLYPVATLVALSSTTALAGDHPLLQRIAERAPLPRTPVEHSAQRAGYPQSVKPHSVPSVTRFDYGGYVGGGQLLHNNLLARGPGSATGPIHDGTFGTDFGGFRGHLGRVFLAPSDDPSRGPAIARNYRTDGPRVTDVFALRPLRKAILEKREAVEEHGHGHHGHGHGGNGHGGNRGH